MLKIFLCVLIIVLIAVILLSVGILLKGRFASQHVSGNKYLASKGIHCAQTQDKEARKANRAT